MYRLADCKNRSLGLFDTPDEAMKAAPAATAWRPVTDRGFSGDYDGWRPGGLRRNRGPHFTVRLVGDRGSTEGRAL